MVVIRASNNQDLLRGNPFVSDTPLTGDFAGSVGGFGSRDHSGDLLVAKSLAELFGEDGPLSTMGGHVGQCDCK